MSSSSLNETDSKRSNVDEEEERIEERAEDNEDIMEDSMEEEPAEDDERIEEENSAAVNEEDEEEEDVAEEVVVAAAVTTTPRPKLLVVLSPAKRSIEVASPSAASSKRVKTADASSGTTNNNHMPVRVQNSSEDDEEEEAEDTDNRPRRRVWSEEERYQHLRDIQQQLQQTIQAHSGIKNQNDDNDDNNEATLDACRPLLEQLRDQVLTTGYYTTWNEDLFSRDVIPYLRVLKQQWRGHPNATCIKELFDQWKILRATSDHAKVLRRYLIALSQLDLQQDPTDAAVPPPTQPQVMSALQALPFCNDPSTMYYGSLFDREILSLYSCLKQLATTFPAQLPSAELRQLVVQTYHACKQRLEAQGWKAPIPVRARKPKLQLRALPQDAVTVLGERQAKLLKTFRKHMYHLQNIEHKRKPDMIAYKEMRQSRELRRRFPFFDGPRRHGLIEGVPIGLRLRGRGEAAVLGIHRQMMRGIDFEQNEPCFAVCVSGGYEDDNVLDNGDILYTGEGGQTKGFQTEDQKEKNGNAALVKSCRTRTPIRVIRGGAVDGGGAEYCYEGLYECVEYDHVQSTQNPDVWVYQFHLRPIAGQSIQSGIRVEHGRSVAAAAAVPRGQAHRRLQDRIDQDERRARRQDANEQRKRSDATKGSNLGN